MVWLLKKRQYAWPASETGVETILHSLDSAIMLLERRLSFSKYQLVVSAAAATFLLFNAGPVGSSLEAFGLNQAKVTRLGGTLLPFWALGIGGSLISIWAIEHNLSKADNIRYAVQTGDRAEFVGRNYIFGPSWIAFWMGDSLAKTNLIQALLMVGWFLITIKGDIIEHGLGWR